MAKRVGIVILGDEVLKAEIREANIAYMLPLLNEWGAEVAFCAILPDDVPTVVRHLAFLRRDAELLILTGGIGPTPDDITRDAVAAVAGVPLVVHPDAMGPKHVAGQASRIEKPQLQTLVTGLQGSPDDPTRHERVDVVHDVPVVVPNDLKRWVGVHPDQALDLDDKSCLFLNLAHDGRRHGFPDLDGTAGETPETVVRPALQEDCSVLISDDGGYRRSEFRRLSHIRLRLHGSLW